MFVFAPNGVVIASAINASGAMHDSIIAERGRIFGKLEHHYKKTGGRSVVDSALSKGSYTS